MQLSSMLKLSVVRCFNTGILVYLTVRDVLGYDKTFHQDALKQIQGILIADAVSSPILRFLDLGGMYSRYVKAPTVHTQEEMDSLWSAQDWSLAERYTDVLKTIFVIDVLRASTLWPFHHSVCPWCHICGGQVLSVSRVEAALYPG